MKTKMKFAILILTLIFETTSLLAQEINQMSLDDAHAYAMNNSAIIKNAQLAIQDADQLILERKSIGLPKVNGTIEYQYFFKTPITTFPEELVANGFPREVSFALKHNFTPGIAVNSLIFDGSYIVGLRAARLFREFTNQDLLAKKQDLKNKVTEAYIPALIITESLRTLDKNISNLNKIFFETKEMYKAGFVEQLDVDRLELSLANIKVERENLIRQYTVVIDALKFTIGFPIKEELQLKDDINQLLIEATDDDLSKVMNYYDRPEYKLAELNTDLNKMNIKANQAGYLPNMLAFASYQYGFQGNKLNDSGFWAPTGVIGATINIPIYDGGDKKAKIQRAKIKVSLAEIQLKELERGITLELKTARTNYLNAKQRLESQKKNLALAEKIYKTTQVKYKEGVGSSLEITQSEQSLYQSQQNHTQALYDLLVAKKALDKALGK